MRDDAGEDVNVRFVRRVLFNGFQGTSMDKKQAMQFINAAIDDL